MGCCISKCRPENNDHSQEEHHHHHHQFNHVQDKLVISQASPLPPPTINPRPLKYKISPSPPSPTSSSTSSISSFACTTTTSNTISSSSSLSSASSATLTSKDRSFSNEFLWSCYKDNPHIIRINSLRDASLSLTDTKPKSEYQPKSNINPSPPKPGLAPPILLKQHSPSQKVVGSLSTMPQKRVRSNSPTNLTRQKSFRKEQPERPVRLLGSPSPSRRFSNGGEKCGSSLGTTTRDATVSKGMSSSPKVSAVQYSRSVSSSLRNKEGVRAASPNNNSLGRLQYSGLRHKATRTLRVGSKIDETVVQGVLSNHDMDLDLTEDIDNPLISLDCFIFL